jgi:hypothetical protein
MITRKRVLVVCAVVVLGLGLFSCTLEPTVGSPSREAAALPKGMPGGLSVFKPSITFDGTTTILTYKITADFSGWPVTSLNYIAEGSPDATSEPQSIDALIHYYQVKGLFGPGVANNYLLETNGQNGNLPPYVIIPLDTSLIRDYLEKRLKPSIVVPENDEDIDVPLVWIEENLTIGKVETVDTTGNNNWKGAVYEDEVEGIRIGGCYVLSSSPPPANEITVSTVKNFDDGKDDRIRSIATVLADEKDRDKKRYTSAINFYADKEAKEIERELPGTSSSGTLNSAKALKTWMRTNKPVLRVVYQWAD